MERSRLRSCRPDRSKKSSALNRHRYSLMVEDRDNNPLPDIMDNAEISPPSHKRKRDRASAPPNTPRVPQPELAHPLGHVDEELHQRKRSRRSESPTVPADPKMASLGRSTRRLRASKIEASPRPSRFVEGSMNDRISKKPPSMFTKEERSMEEYMDESCTLLEALGARPSQDLVSFGDGIEISKPSSMYRFGRAIVNAFKPSALWGDPKPRKTAEVPSIAEAERAWAELKASGFAGCKSTYISDETKRPLQTAAIASRDPTAAKVTLVTASDTPSSRPDGGNRTSIEGCVNNQSPLQPIERSQTPSSATGSRSKSFLRAPSLHNLRRAASHVQISSLKAQTTNDHTTEDTPEVPPVPMAHQSLRNEPSKKDLAKQQRLSKRVSNLEAQLEIARRELQKSVTSPEPALCHQETPVQLSRKAFVPGLLPSLPSERVINAKLEALGQSNQSAGRPEAQIFEPTATHEQMIDSQTPHTPQSKVASEVTLEAAAQLERELDESLHAHAVKRKRKSGPKSAGEGDQVEQSSTASSSVTNKRNKSSRPVERPRKAELVPTASSSLHDESPVPPMPLTPMQDEIPSATTQSDAQCTPTLAPPRHSPLKRGVSRSALKSALSPTSSKIVKPSSHKVYGSRSPLCSLSASSINILPPVLENSSAVVDDLVKSNSPRTTKRALSTSFIPKEDFEWPEDVF